MPYSEPSDPRPPDHNRRLEQARARAGWELGDRGWADKILLAYWNPERDAEVLREEQAD